MSHNAKQQTAAAAAAAADGVRPRITRRLTDNTDDDEQVGHVYAVWSLTGLPTADPHTERAVLSWCTGQ